MSQRFLIWYWSGGGGGSQFAVNLAKSLARRFGADAIALSLRADDPAVERASDLGLQVNRAAVTSQRSRPLRTFAGLAESARVLRNHARGADKIIVPMNFAVAAPLSFTLTAPLIYFAHDPAPHPGDYSPFGQRATQALLLRRASRVVALSDFAARRLERSSGVRRKLSMMPLGAVFEPASTAGAPAGAGPLKFLLAGRMIAYKGLDLLADALDRLAHRDDWRLTVAGAGPALDAAMRARLVHPQIEQVRGDWLGEAELEALIAECDVVLAPYRSATQSGIVAQALAMGKPCIVTPVGALAEQIGAGEAGWVAAAAAGPAFAAAMKSVLRDRAGLAVKAQAAGEMAREAWAAEHWDWLAR